MNKVHCLKSERLMIKQDWREKLKNMQSPERLHYDCEEIEG